MCVVSMIGDHYSDRFNKPYYVGTFTNISEISRAEFEALKREVEEMKELLKKALKYDEENGEPECHMDEKVERLKKVAELVGVSLDEVFGKKSSNFTLLTHSNDTSGTFNKSKKMKKMKKN